MKDFIDTHTHILPGLDDGPEDMETALELLGKYRENNITKIICTPHIFHGLYDNDKSGIMKVFNEFQARARDEFPEIKLYPGSEIMIYFEMEKDLKSDKLITVNDGDKYILVEFPLSSYPPFADDLLFKLQIAGLFPIISHPERYTEIIRNPVRVFKWIERGMYIQLNSGSITGRFGQKVRETADFLVTHHLFHLVGTDSHSIKTRPPDLARAYQILKEKLDPGQLKVIFKDNPNALLENGSITGLEVIPYESRKSRFRNFIRKIFNS